MGRTRKDLPLSKKVDVICKSEAGKSSRFLAKEFGVGKTQINNIVKRKLLIMEEFSCLGSEERCRKDKETDNEELNAAMYEWFKLARSKNMPVSGPILQAKAKEFAEQLGLTTFKASNGWLASFRRRHKIVVGACGDRQQVQPISVADWKAQLPIICEGYRLEDIWTMGETGLYFRALPDRALSILKVKSESCGGEKAGKDSKERLTLSLCCSMAGEKDKPLLIGRSDRPRCFKNLDVNNLPVTWRSNKKAWMTSLTFEDWLTRFNSQMRQQKRRILLFLDNATCHPAMTLSNVKLWFLPPSKTSKVQPLDQGLIKALKACYRKKLLQHLIGQTDLAAASATESGRQITVLDAAYWIADAWNKTSASTIQKCFEASGFTSMYISETSEEVIEPDCKRETEQEGVELTRRVTQELGGRMQWKDYLAIDDKLATHDSAKGNWERELLNCFVTSRDVSQEGSDCEVPSEAQPSGSLQEMLGITNALKAHAIQNGDTDILSSVMSLKDVIESKHLALCSPTM